ncbi:hypothetical protein V6N11_012335 [Hibiscus sabdariffa]|uniref:Uncharacterized protein n=1 Tax=Hibiscus sabdariffa TaxID=183260 RepID=A0ABR2QAS7_9ROSI
MAKLDCGCVVRVMRNTISQCHDDLAVRLSDRRHRILAVMRGFSKIFSSFSISQTKKKREKWSSVALTDSAHRSDTGGDKGDDCYDLSREALSCF